MSFRLPMGVMQRVPRAAAFLLLLCAQAVTADPWRDDLRPLAAEDWSEQRAAHLLERAGFGGTPEQVAALAALPPEEAVRGLVRWQEQPNAPLPAFKESGIFPSEDFVPPLDGDLEEIIIRSVVTRRGLGVKLGWSFQGPWLQPIFDQFFYLLFANALETSRLAAWQADRMLRTERPLEEKLALFWHGHFATEGEKVRDYRKMKAQWELYRAHGNGSFRSLLQGIARDPAMLIYLDGVSNVKAHPNENFARELLELFTLGTGHYSEQDIQETARAFTGWGLDGNAFEKSWRHHDRSRKTVLGVSGRLDGDDVVDAILAQPAAAEFLAARLYAFFVRPDPSPELRTKLAAQLRESDYEIAPLLETLLLSRDFHSATSHGAHVKGPVELVVSTYKRLGLEELPGVPLFDLTTKQLGQGLFAPPNVAGWAGGHSWVNPSTLTSRQNFTRQLLFPSETPPLEKSLHELIVSTAVGPDLYARLKQMDLEGRHGEPVALDPGEAGLARQANDSQGLFELPWAIWNGADKAISTIRLDGLTVASFRLAPLVRAAGVEDAEGATRVLAERFLRVPLSEAQQAVLAERLRQRMGGSQIDWERDATEQDLRELLHLILSLPEYQIS